MRFGFFLCLLLLLGSCKSEQQVPEGVLTPKELTPVLWDLLRSDEMAIVTMRPDSIMQLYPRSVALYQQIFRMHRTDQATVRKSLQYYQQNPQHFQVVLDSLQKRADTSIRKIDADTSRVRIAPHS